MPRFEPTFSGLLPHAPILIPDVAGRRLADCRETVAACRQFAKRLVASAPQRLFLISPHSPRHRKEFGIWPGPNLTGDLAAFGFAKLQVEVPFDRNAASTLQECFADLGLGLRPIASDRLDHGASVPLWFLAEAGWNGPTTVLSLPESWDVDLEAAGRGLGAAAARLGPVAVVASGDMSHRLAPGAPAGFHPEAQAFDQALETLVIEDQLHRIGDMDPRLRDLAAEDAADSVQMVAAAHEFRCRGREVLSYEHPFGVGYLVAVFWDSKSTGSEVPPAWQQLPAVAREAVHAELQGRRPKSRKEEKGCRDRAAVFVTLRQADGELRGCIGSLAPQQANLWQETRDRALAAAFQDPRFPPVKLSELALLQFEVSVLTAPETVDREELLDPKRYGVVVHGSGGRRGVLLPDLEGVDTVDQQIAIACRKAGLRPGAVEALERFEVIKLSE